MNGPFEVWIHDGRPELLGTYPDKGACRRAWRTAPRGAAMCLGAEVLELKSGTTPSVERALRAAIAKAHPHVAPVAEPEPVAAAESVVAPEPAPEAPVEPPAEPEPVVEPAAEVSAPQGPALLREWIEAHSAPAEDAPAPAPELPLLGSADVDALHAEIDAHAAEAPATEEQLAAVGAPEAEPATSATATAPARPKRPSTVSRKKAPPRRPTATATAAPPAPDALNDLARVGRCVARVGGIGALERLVDFALGLVDDAREP